MSGYIFILQRVYTRRQMVYVERTYLTSSSEVPPVRLAQLICYRTEDCRLRKDMSHGDP